MKGFKQRLREHLVAEGFIERGHCVEYLTAVLEPICYTLAARTEVPSWQLAVVETVLEGETFTNQLQRCLIADGEDGDRIRQVLIEDDTIYFDMVKGTVWKLPYRELVGKMSDTAYYDHILRRLDKEDHVQPFKHVQTSPTNKISDCPIFRILRDSEQIWRIDGPHNLTDASMADVLQLVPERTAAGQFCALGRCVSKDGKEFYLPLPTGGSRLRRALETFQGSLVNGERVTRTGRLSLKSALGEEEMAFLKIVIADRFDVSYDTIQLRKEGTHVRVRIEDDMLYANFRFRAEFS